MKKIKFKNLPRAVSELNEKLVNIERLLNEKSDQSRVKYEPSEDVFTIQQAASFLHLSVPTLYSKNSKGELPTYKRGKRLYFLRTDLLAWLKEGRRKTNAEIQAEAHSYLKKRGRNE